MASEGPRSPATIVNESDVGPDWISPENAGASDNIYSVLSSTISEIEELSDYIKATNFGFTIPSGATIDGIVVEIERKSDIDLGFFDSSITIVKGGVHAGTDHAASALWSSTESYVSFGSPTDKWGLTWTDTDINSTGFGVATNIQNALGLGEKAYIDHIRITVHYTAASGGAFIAMRTTKIVTDPGRGRESMPKFFPLIPAPPILQNIPFSVVPNIPGSKDLSARSKYFDVGSYPQTFKPIDFIRAQVIDRAAVPTPAAGFFAIPQQIPVPQPIPFQSMAWPFRQDFPFPQQSYFPFFTPTEYWQTIPFVVPTWIDQDGKRVIRPIVVGFFPFVSPTEVFPLVPFLMTTPVFPPRKDGQPFVFAMVRPGIDILTTNTREQSASRGLDSGQERDLDVDQRRGISGEMVRALITSSKT